MQNRTEVLDGKPLKELVRDLSCDSKVLMRQETELFKREMELRLQRIEREVAAIGSGGLIAYIGILALTSALILVLDTVMPGWSAALIVGCGYIVGGLTLLLMGRNKLKHETVKPERTIESVKRDARAFREATT
jgi:putative superfamily III holin-X